MITWYFFLFVYGKQYGGCSTIYDACQVSYIFAILYELFSWKLDLEEEHLLEAIV